MVEVVTRFKVLPIRCPAHLALVRSWGCCVPFCTRCPIHAHHVTTVGAGGGDDATVGLCWWHHAQWHRLGRRTWADLHGLDLVAIAGWNAFHSRYLGVLK